MKDSIKEKISLGKEIFKILSYSLILIISSTVARMIKAGVKDKWVLLGIIGSLTILFISIRILKRIEEQIKSLKEIE